MFVVVKTLAEYAPPILLALTRPIKDELLVDRSIASGDRVRLHVELRTFVLVDDGICKQTPRMQRARARAQRAACYLVNSETRRRSP